MTEDRAAWATMTLRARELRSGDVVKVRVGPRQDLHWLAVKSVYTNYEVGLLKDVAQDVRAGNSESPRRFSNIGIALFINGTHESDQGQRLERVESGLSVIVNLSYTNDPADSDNWFELRSLDLFEIQVYA